MAQAGVAAAFAAVGTEAGKGFVQREAGMEQNGKLAGHACHGGAGNGAQFFTQGVEQAWPALFF